MARPKPKPEEIKPAVIEKAVELMQKKGFESLTMKALASECGMSVGKLYHFFPRKDDLFLQLEIEYFEGLYQRLSSVLSGPAIQCRSERDRFRCLLGEYFDYAVAHFDLYQLVTMPPKVFSHYVGTGSEALAQKELRAALRVINFVRDAFFALMMEQGKEVGDAALQESFLLVINAMHGLILMSRSAAWPYISRPIRSESDLSSASEAVEVAVARQLDLLLQSCVRK